MRNFKRLYRILRDIYGDSAPSVREIRLVLAVGRVLHGDQPETVSAELRLQPRVVESQAAAMRAKDLHGFSVAEYPISAEILAGRRQGISQMLLGALAERRFEELTESITGGRVLKIEDHRPSRTDTDYRLLNGNDSPICRLNIKFHGTLFRDAPRYVWLEPQDCFALVTYKINNALKRQDSERLPYVFLVLSVPDLSSADVGKLIPDDYVWALAVLKGKRSLEEAIVDHLRSPDYLDRFRPIFERMPEGQFRIISAKKAYRLLTERLFERVHALSLKGFTRRFRNAEIDMHFSLSTELTPIRTFLELLVRESPQKFAVSLYIGDY